MLGGVHSPGDVCKAMSLECCGSSLHRKSELFERRASLKKATSGTFPFVLNFRLAIKAVPPLDIGLVLVHSVIT